MRLWTWHTPDFSLLTDKVRLCRSAYYNNPSLRQLKSAYAELAKRLQTDQMIWCYARRSDYKLLPSEEKIEWEIEVPSSAVLAVVDGFVWNMILGIRCDVSALRDEAWQRSSACGHPEEYDAVLKGLMDEFFAYRPEHVLWEELFISDPFAEGATPLVTHPLKEEWIIARRMAEAARLSRDPALRRR